MPTVLWWGRSDPEYSRNRLILKLFRKMAVRVDFFHPRTSMTGTVEAFFNRSPKPDLVWVPCFRQTDIASASFWADRWNVPLVIDPLISAYQKELHERGKFEQGSTKARKRLRWETDLFRRADLVIADTPAHADFFHDVLAVERQKLAVLYVGADEGMFTPCAPKEKSDDFEVLFYGSFLALQGPEVIVEAARLLRHLPIRFTLLGDGDLKPAIVRQAEGIDSISFEGWIPFDKLPARLCQADILLGIFGSTPKAALVIPNKMFQSMAVGRPVITMASPAYPDELLNNQTIGWTEGGNAGQLAEKITHFHMDRQGLPERGKQTQKLFYLYFSEVILEKMVREIMQRVGKHQRFR